MKRGLLTLLALLGVSVAAFFAWRFVATKPVREVMRMDHGEMEWLRQEFNLDQSEFRNIAALHTAYRPKCEALCRQVLAANARTRTILDANDAVTPEVRSALQEAARLQAECRAAMLAHAYEVGREMGGKRKARYLAMMKDQALAPPLMEPDEQHSMTTHGH